MTARLTTGLIRCELCDKVIADVPHAIYAHKSKHVREGKMRRIPTGNGRADRFEIVEEAKP